MKCCRKVPVRFLLYGPMQIRDRLEHDSFQISFILFQDPHDVRVGQQLSRRADLDDEYSQNDGRLEVAQQMANHESAHTTGLYDRRDDEVSLDEVEKTVI